MRNPAKIHVFPYRRNNIPVADINFHSPRGRVEVMTLTIDQVEQLHRRLGEFYRDATGSKLR